MNLETLTPERKDLVMDLVRRSGIDVRGWAKYRGGKKKAAANPKYCYEWSFVGNDKIVLNLWRGLMKQGQSTFVLTHNTRNGAIRQRAKPAWRRRSAKVDEAIQIAARDGLPIRAIVCDGKRRRWSTGGKASEVKARELDPLSWAVTAYDSDTGDYTLTRGRKPKRLITEVVLSGPRAEDDLADKVDAEAPVLMRFARAVKQRLGNPDGIRYKKKLQPYSTYSGGNRAVIARFRGGRGGTVEVWLDRFVDGKVPRFQYCVAATSDKRIKEMEEAAKSVVGYVKIRRINVTDTGTLMKMDPPLAEADFGRPVIESYDTNEAYLGVYHPSLNAAASNLGPLANKAVAFFTPLIAAIRDYDRDLTPRRGRTPRRPSKAEQESALRAAETEREAGQRFSFSAKDRKALEDYGMKRAAQWLARTYPRYKVEDVHKGNPCDFDCSCGRERFLVEVKCTQTPGASVFLSKNEVELVKNQRGKMLLLVVSGVTLRYVKGRPMVSGGTVRPVNKWRIAAEDLVAITYQYRVPT